MSDGQNADKEIEALYAVWAALEPLDDAARARVLAYFVARCNIDPGVFT